MYNRLLPIKKLMGNANYFLFGPRSTGKSTWIVHQLKSEVEIIDLLLDDVYEEYLRRPSLLRERFAHTKKIVVIDEIQKLPKLLDEVQNLIVKNKVRFLLTGSSARKLKREGANMLGGRAREAHFFPLLYKEIDDFDLLKYLNYGGLPIIYLSSEPKEDLKAYIRLYLNEEIKKEAAVRNYERFVRFLEVMSLCNGQEINYAQLASDTGIPARTIEGHIEVLKDTLIAFELYPYSKTIKRKAVTRSKFYFFDTGVANQLAGRIPLTANHSEIGISFEQFIINEVRAYISYRRRDINIYFWRSRDYEVDLLIGDEIAIEIKFAEKVKNEFFDGLLALKQENLQKQFHLVGRFSRGGEYKDCRYWNWQVFLETLWQDKLF
jgi:predicted AAA+ superfamily ATPase